MTDLTVTCRSIYFLVSPNWFCRTEAANDDTRIVLYSCGIPHRNSSAISGCWRNVHHLYQFPDCLVAVALAIPLEESMLTLAIISRIEHSWASVWCGTILLPVVVGFGWNVLLVSGLTYVNTVRGNPRWCFMFPWCVMSIAMSRYWQFSIQASLLFHHAILCSLGWRMSCASSQVRWNCLWMTRFMTPVPFLEWSCRWSLLMLVIIEG